MTAPENVPLESVPLEPWVARARQWVINLGFASPVATFIWSLFGESSSTTWALIGLTVTFSVFAPAALIFAFVVPTMKARLLCVPVLFLIAYAILGTEQRGIKHPGDLLMWLSILTFSALTLVVGEIGVMRRFYARTFLKR